jgi:hypothetical protein
MTGRDAHMEAELESQSLHRFIANKLGADSPAVTAMPPEYRLIHPRRVRSSGWDTQPDGQVVHFFGYERLTPQDEVRYRLSDPENGLHPEDLLAFRASLQCTLKRGTVERFLSWLKL